MNQLAITPSAGMPTTLLAQRPNAPLPIGGVIRPGIKVLTASAEANDTARTLYEEGCEQGQSFDAIEKVIQQAVPALKSPLRPANVPYFSARRGDFPMPELADLLLQKYGEVRDDGVRRLYRFPVIFAADAWPLLMPHTLQVWASGKRRYWAEYDEAGLRRCKTFAAVPKDASGKVIRIFGGRKIVDRPENGGLCEPEGCPQYQMRQCNLDARLLFIVPGLPTINLIALPTRSFYSMEGIRQQLEHVAAMRGGRLSGYLHGQRTFWVTKVYRDVSRIDDNGDAIKSGAWLIELQADVDIGGLLLAHDTARTAADAAAQVLEHGVVDMWAADSPSQPAAAPPAPAASVARPGAARVKQLRQQVAEALERHGIAVEEFKAFAQDTWRTDDWGRNADVLLQAIELLQVVGPQRTRLQMLLQGLGVPTDRYALYAQRRFRREHWAWQPETLLRALREAEEYAQAPEALVATIDAELDGE